MVAVAPDHALQQPQMLFVHSGEPVFVDDQDALAVADVQQRRGHRVVRCAVGVAAQLFELADAPFLKRIRDAGAHPGMVLMHVYPLEFQGFAVEQKAPVGGEFCIPYTDYGFVPVGDNAAALDGGEHLVQIRVSGVPEVRGAYGHGQAAGGRLLGKQSERFGACGSHLPAFGIRQDVPHKALCGLKGAVLYVGIDMDEGL